MSYYTSQAQSAYDNRTPTTAAQEAFYDAVTAEEERISDVLYDIFGDEAERIIATLDYQITAEAIRRVKERNEP